ncbi:hypothetical protein OAT45_04470 [Alphaproteobacteria bacterium]|nr:hypothetical protein [Alphaproteobacteria bacterium]
MNQEAEKPSSDGGEWLLASPYTHLNLVLALLDAAHLLPLMEEALGMKMLV